VLVVFQLPALRGRRPGRRSGWVTIRRESLPWVSLACFSILVFTSCLLTTRVHGQAASAVKAVSPGSPGRLRGFIKRLSLIMLLTAYAANSIKPQFCLVATSNRNPPLALTPSCKLSILNERISSVRVNFSGSVLEKTSK
jgi:hypothetical protein